MAPSRRTNRGHKRPAISPPGHEFPRGGIQHAEAAEHAVAARRREDNDPPGRAWLRLVQDGREVLRERFHLSGAVDDLLDDGDPFVGGEGRVHQGAWDDVSALLADEEEQRGQAGTAVFGVPLGVVVEDEMREGVAVARVAAEDLEGGLLGDGGEGAGGGWAYAVDGDVLQVRPFGGVFFFFFLD